MLSIFLCLCILGLYLETYLKCRDNRKSLRHRFFLKIDGSSVLLVMQSHTSIISFLGNVHSSLCTAFYFNLYWDPSAPGGIKGKQSPEHLKRLTATSNFPACSTKISVLFSALESFGS